MWNVEFPSLDSSSAYMLEISFTMEKVYNALKDPYGDKALGLDRFPFKFAQSFWYVFKDELIALFQVFHCFGEFD